MKSLTHRRLAPIAGLIFLNGLLLTSLSLLLDIRVPERFLVLNSSPNVYALMDVGKWVKSRAHEQYREDMREGFSVGADAWIALYCSPAAKLNLVCTQKNARSWLQKNLHAKYVGKTDILRIWLTDGSPHEQAVIIDTILRRQFEHNERDTIRSLQNEIALSQGFIAQSAQSIVIFETDLRKLVNSVTTRMSMSKLEALLERLFNLARQIAFDIKRIRFHRALIEDDQALLRTRPPHSTSPCQVGKQTKAGGIIPRHC